MLEAIKKFNPYISLLLLAYNIWQNNYNVMFTFKYLTFEISIKFL